MTAFKVAIPARYASSRLPGKPLIDLGGKPMIQHVYERAVESGAEEIVIATDDQRIYDVAEGFGAEVCMTSTEHHSGSDRLAELVDLYGWSDDTIVVNLQGDEPLTPSSILLQAARGLDEHPGAGISTLCAPINSASQLYDPHTVKVVRNQEGFALYFSRAPIPWERDALDVEAHPEHNQAFRHIGLYAYRAGYLREYSRSEPCDLEQIESLEQLRALWQGVKIFVDVAEQLPGHGVDTPEDVETVTALLKQYEPKS